MTIQENEDQGVPHEAAGPDEAEVLDFADVVIGRAAETAALLDVFERVRRDGTTELVTVAGPPGVGKSTLLRAFEERCVGGVVGRGVSREVGGGPYRALAEALDAVAAQMLGAPERTFDRWRSELEHELGDSAGVLAAIAPNLESCLGEIAAPIRVSAGDARSRFDRAVEAFVTTTALAVEPVVLVLEDLQWAEPGTLRAVRAAPRPGASADHDHRDLAGRRVRSVPARIDWSGSQREHGSHRARAFRRARGSGVSRSAAPPASE